MTVKLPRAKGRATLSAFGLVRGPASGAVMTSIGMRLLRRAIAVRVSVSSASTTSFTSSFSSG